MGIVIDFWRLRIFQMWKNHEKSNSLFSLWVHLSRFLFCDKRRNAWLRFNEINDLLKKAHTHRVLRKISSAEGKVTSPTCISLEGHEQCVSGHLDDSSWLGRLSSGHHDIVASSIGSAPQQLSLRFSWSSWHYSFSAPLCGWRPRWEPLKSLNLPWGLEKLRSQGSWNVVSGFPEAIPDMRPGQQHSHSCHHHSHDRPRWQRLMAQDLVTGDRGSETGGDWIQQDVVDSPGFSRMLETWTVWRHSMMQQSDW